MTTTQTEALTLALEALESCDSGHISDGGKQWFDEELVDKAYAAIKEALNRGAMDSSPNGEAQPAVALEQRSNEHLEPVALKIGECWPENVMQMWDYYRKEIANGHTGSEPRDWFESLSEMRLVDTTPPQRTWVGLTDDEIDQGLVRTNYAMQTAGAWRDGVEWATKQLREKNNG